MDFDDVPSTRVAAVQMEARVADIPFNLIQAEQLIDRAAADGAKIIALPEFFTSCIVYDERLFACSLPPDNPALDMLMARAARHQAMIGGSYLEMRNGDVFNTYVLVEPSGTVHRHDKDLPTMVENAFYVGGCDDGVFETGIGPIGAAMCWEMIRTQTARRLVARVDLLMTGSHWWGSPGWRWQQAWVAKADRGNQQMMHRTPGVLASMVGAPLLHGGHTGTLEGGFLVLPGTRLKVATRTKLTGETQIISRDGTLVARLGPEQGAGVVSADIVLGRHEPRAAIPDRFWIPPRLGLGYGLWLHQNACGKSTYRWARRKGRLRPFELGAGSQAECTPQTRPAAGSGTGGAPAGRG